MSINHKLKTWFHYWANNTPRQNPKDDYIKKNPNDKKFNDLKNKLFDFKIFFYDSFGVGIRGENEKRDDGYFIKTKIHDRMSKTFYFS